jgi:hypothetical protein
MMRGKHGVPGLPVPFPPEIDLCRPWTGFLSFTLRKPWNVLFR